jgi:hypothetical protein
MFEKFGVWCCLAGLLAGCTPGYVTADKLASNDQGPSACDARCHELGMRMGALVLVSDNLPACVCQPMSGGVPQPAPPLPPPPPGEAPAAANEAGSAAVGGYVVVAAAAAAARQQQQRQQQQRWSQAK